MTNFRLNGPSTLAMQLTDANTQIRKCERDSLAPIQRQALNLFECTYGKLLEAAILLGDFECYGKDSPVPGLTAEVELLKTQLDCSTIDQIVHSTAFAGRAVLLVAEVEKSADSLLALTKAQIAFIEQSAAFKRAKVRTDGLRVGKGAKCKYAIARSFFLHNDILFNEGEHYQYDATRYDSNIILVSTQNWSVPFPKQLFDERFDLTEF